MPMTDDEVETQLRQMREFILQEAREKAEEIRTKADEDSNREHAKHVQEQRVKLREEFERKEKAFVAQQQIEYSTRLNKARLEVLEARSASVDSIVEEARTRLDSLTSDKNKYQAMLKDLLVQGLLALMENTVQVRCRKQDEALVNAVLGPAVEEFKSKMKRAQAAVTIDTTQYLPPGRAQAGANAEFCSGGVMLVAANGTITLDNTLDARLSIAVEQQKADIRVMLFGKSATRKYDE